MARQLSKIGLPISWVSDWGVDIASYNSGLIVPRIVSHPPMEKSSLEGSRTGNGSMFGQFGFMPWLKYKAQKMFSTKVSNSIE